MNYVEQIRSLVGSQPLILVGSVAIISDENGAILLQHRKFPYGKWGLPGGLMELGESTEDTARREVLEETGLIIGDLNLVGVYSGPDYFITAANGDEVYSVTVAYSTQDVTGELQVDTQESLGFEYADPLGLYDNMVQSHRKIVEQFLEKIEME